MKNSINKTQILLPGGEWLDWVFRTFAVANLSLKAISPGSYRYEFAEANLPFTFVVVRTWEVPLLADNPKTTSWIGLTGSDVLAEMGLQSNLSFPLPEGAPQAELYLGTTEQYPGDCNGELTLQNSTIVTKFPNITKQFLEKIGQKQVTIESFAGKIEGIWNVFPSNWAVVDIAASGRTARCNNIIKRKTVLRPEVVYYVSPKAPAIDVERINQLQELINQAISNRGTYAN